MKKKILPHVILSIVLLGSSLSFARETVPAPPDITAESAVLMEASTHTVLYEKNAGRKMYPASITKILTAYLILENKELSDPVVHSNEAVFGIARNSSHIAMDVGEIITTEEALYGMMLASANEVSVALAESLDGSVEQFSRRMNETAQKLGASRTRFVNPNGLPDKNHYTTAYDMALISAAGYENEMFRKIIGTLSYTIPPTNKQEESRTLYNQHSMLYKNNNYSYPGSEGGKTGYTTDAGHTLVTYAVQNGMTLIAVVLNSGKNEKYTDTKALFDYGFENFQPMEMYNGAVPFYQLPVVDSKTVPQRIIGRAALKTDGSFSAIAPKSASLKDIEMKIETPDQLSAPVHENDEAGEIQFYYEGKSIGAMPLYVASSSEFPVNAVSVFKAQKNVYYPAFLYGGVVFFCFILIQYVIQNIKRKRRRRRMYSNRYRIRTHSKKYR